MKAKRTFERRKPEDSVQAGKRPFDSVYTFPKDTLLNIIYDFTYTLFSYAKVADKYKVTEAEVRDVLSKFRYDLNRIGEAWDLIHQHPYLNGAIGVLKTTIIDGKGGSLKDHGPQGVSEAFKRLLSKDDEPVLSEAEQKYAWYFVHTGNNDAAMKAAGLCVGLQIVEDELGKNKTSTKNTLALRGYFLRSKPNVKKYIYELRERKLTDIQIDKEYIQLQLVTFIEQLQEEGNPKERNKLLRALELLGRTVPGTFTETINISEVKPDEALDKLLEMSRSVMVHEKTKKLPPPLFRPDNDDDDEEIVYEYKD